MPAQSLSHPSPRWGQACSSLPPHKQSSSLFFCLTCCSSLWEEHGLQLVCIPDHLGCRGYPGGSGAAGSTSVLFVVRRDLAGEGTLGQRWSGWYREIGSVPRGKNGSPSKPVRRQFHFLQSQLLLFKACRFGSHGDGASDFVESAASQRGLWERFHDGSPLYLKRAGHQGKGRNSGLHDLLSCVPSVPL